MNKTIKVLRWIAVLPGAITISIIVALVAYYSQRFFSDDSSMYSKYVIPFSSCFAGSITSNIWGSRIAPSHQKIVSLILLILTCISFGINGWSDFIYSNYTFLFVDVFSILGAFAGFIVIKYGEE